MRVGKVAEHLREQQTWLNAIEGKPENASRWSASG